MSSHVSKPTSLPQGRAAGTHRSVPAQRRRAALRRAWVAHAVKRALAEVASTCDEDYRAFGWERRELIARLEWLHDVIGRVGPGGHAPVALAPLRTAA